MWPFNSGKKRYHEIESIERKKGGGRKRLSTAGDDRLSTKLCLKDRKASSTDLKQDWEKYTGVRTSGTTVRRRLLTQGLGTGGVCQLKPQLIMLSHFVRWPLQCLKSPYMISHLLISCLLTNLVLQLLDCCVYDLHADVCVTTSLSNNVYSKLSTRPQVQNTLSTKTSLTIVKSYFWKVVMVSKTNTLLPPGLQGASLT